MATIRGTDGPNTLNGTSSNDRIYGYNGNDILDGKGGIDTLLGGRDNDTYIVDSTTDTITELSGGGTDTVNSSVSYTLAPGSFLNNLTLTGSSTINGTGNEYNNIIRGNSAGNILNGSSGIDTLIGGGGNDTYIVDTTTDTITELTNGGIDTVQSSVSYTLAPGSFLNNLTLTGSSAINGTGNEYDNIIRGNSGINTLRGGSGNDDIQDRGGGNNRLYGGDGNDRVGGGDFDVYGVQVYGDAGDDSVFVVSGVAYGGTGNDYLNALFADLYGESGNDTLQVDEGSSGYGGDGNDFLTGFGGSVDGGNGNDVLSPESDFLNMTGGAGADIFLFDSSAGFDNRIQDFEAADTIYISAITFGGGLEPGPLDSDQFVRGSSARDSEDRFIYNSQNELFFDRDGLGGSDQNPLVTFTGNYNLGASDFLIV